MCKAQTFGLIPVKLAFLESCLGLSSTVSKGFLPVEPGKTVIVTVLYWWCADLAVLFT